MNISLLFSYIIHVGPEYNFVEINEWMGGKWGGGEPPGQYSLFASYNSIASSQNKKKNGENFKML